MFHKRLSVRDAAEMIGISTTTLSEIRTGKRRPSAVTLTLIAEKLDIDDDELFRLAGYIEGNETARDHLEQQAVDAFRRLPPDRRDIALKMMRALIE